MTLLTEIFVISAEQYKPDDRDYIKEQKKDLYIITTLRKQLLTCLSRLTLPEKKPILTEKPETYFQKIQSNLADAYGEKSAPAGQIISELLIKVLDYTLAKLESQGAKEDQPLAKKCLQLVEEATTILTYQRTLLNIKNVTTIAKIDVD